MWYMLQAEGPTRLHAGPSEAIKSSSASGNSVKIAHLYTSDKVLPLVRRELADGTIRTVGISYQDRSILTRNFNARSAFA